LSLAQDAVIQPARRTAHPARAVSVAHPRRTPQLRAGAAASRHL